MQVDTPLPLTAPEVREFAAPKSRPRRRLGWFARRAAVAALVVFFVRTFIGEASLVPTSSMESTILVGDHLLLNKALYGPQIPFTNWRLPRLKTVQRGEIVAFSAPRDPNLTFIKRVIGVEGDLVEIRRGTVILNGQPMTEPYAVYRRARQRSMPPVRVPAGHLFVLGDNRDHSQDSRAWGTVPVENVIGEPLMIYWSYDAPSAQWLDADWLNRLRFYGGMPAHLMARTRWWRTGTLL